jgi:hypothetical protein
MHGTFYAPSGIKKAANQWTAAVRTTVFNGVNRPLQIEECDLDVIEPDELTTARGQLIQRASFEPIWDFHW